MKTLCLLLLAFLISVCLTKNSYSQEDTTQVAEDTTAVDTTAIAENDPVKQEISRIVKEVNTRFMAINDIHSEGEIKIKTPKYDESASIEMNVKKKDDIWFKIEGPLGIDVAQAHFERKRFVFLNDLNDEAITGSSTIINIGTLTKIRCTFDDLLNAFSGSVRISKSKSDSVSMTEDASTYVISLKRGTITRKYWIDKTYFNVIKYAYLSKKMETLIQFEFSNFENTGTGSYAKKVEIRRPKQNEYFSVRLDQFGYNQPNLNFTISVPSDYKRKNWK